MPDGEKKIEREWRRSLKSYKKKKKKKNHKSYYLDVFYDFITLMWYVDTARSEGNYWNVWYSHGDALFLLIKWKNKSSKAFFFEAYERMGEGEGDFESNQKWISNLSSFIVWSLLKSWIALEY